MKTKIETGPWPNLVEPFSYLESRPIVHKEKRNRRRGWGYVCCPCSLLWIVFWVLCTLILLAILISLLVARVGIRNAMIMKTTTNIKIVNTTAKVNTTTTSSTTTPTKKKTTTTMITTSTISSSTTTFYCGPSCLDQSWIDSSGVIARWPFDGSYNDLTNVYNGIPSPNLPTFVTGYLGQAASFNATAKQAMYTSFIPLNNNSFTVEAWIKPTGYPNPSDLSIVGLCPVQTVDNCLHINIRNTKLYLGFFYNDVSGESTILLDQWIHAAFVFDATAKIQTIYLNGFQDGQASVTSTLQVATGNFTIGTNQGVAVPDNYFQGYIDQLSINRRVKPSCELLEIATLCARFKFDSASPSIDSGPNAVMTSSSNSLIISGYVNQAISFSGLSTSYFQAWGFPSLGIINQAFSITFWIQPQTLSGTLLHLSTSSLGTGSVCFPLLGFASNGAIVAQVLTSSSTVVTAIGPILPVSSSWIPIVQTWSSANGLRLYVNNTLVNSVPSSTFLASGITLNYLTLGNCLNGCGGGCSNGLVDKAGPFTGAIDDWRVYSRELTSNDVCALYFAN